MCIRALQAWQQGCTYLSSRHHDPRKWLPVRDLRLISMASKWAVGVQAGVGGCTALPGCRHMGSWVATSRCLSSGSEGKSCLNFSASDLTATHHVPPAWGASNAHLPPRSFCGSGVQARFGWTFCSGSRGYNQGVSWAGFSSGDLTGENLLPSSLELLAAPTLVAVGLRALSYRWEPRSAPRGHTLPCHTVISHQGRLLFQSHTESLFHQSAKLPAAAAAKSLQSHSVWPHRRQPIRLPCPWDSPGKNTGVGCHFPLQCMKVKSESEVIQSWPTLCDPTDCSPPGSSIHGIFQARVLEWGAIAFSG